ncbi:MAG: hypothetical protein Q9220_006324 [cf. Caloplaca sp. 1 TL-2023]
MIIAEEEAVELKSWVVKKLEDISDADSDVLADYVLALIQAELPEDKLRDSVIYHLADFLQDKAEKFVDETFQILHSKSYMPGYVPPNTAIPPVTTSPIIPSGAKFQASPQSQTRPSAGATDQSRKRSYNEHQSSTGANDSHYARGDRQTKQLRRGGARGGRHDFSQGRPPYFASGAPPQASSPSQFPFPGMSPPSTDPNDPLMAMMLQAMGMPVPQAPSSTATIPQHSPMGQSSPGQAAFPLEGERKTTFRERCHDYDTKGFCVRGNTCSFEHGTDHMVAPGQEYAEYDPKNSAITDLPATSPRASGFGNHDAYAWGRDQDQASTRGHGGSRGRGGRAGSIASRRTNNRADFSQAGPNFDQSRTQIVVEQIPEDRFSEQSVRDFFSAFGIITNVDMQPYKHLAIVTYSEYWAARQAYESPKVIFDNRFVKVYWYQPTSQTAPNGTRNGSASAVSPTVSKGEGADFDKDEFEKNAMAAQKKLEEKRALVKEAEAKRQVLEKQKEELAQKQAEEKKKLLEKLAAKRVPESADSKDAETTEKKHTNGTHETDDKASAQTKALRAQVAALEAEAKSLGLDTALTEDPWAGRGRGRATAYNLDNRTKKISISGADLSGNKDEALRQHLFAIGEFEAIEPHADKPDTQIVTFKDRKTAEKFMYGTKDIPSVGKVELTWINTPLPPASTATKVNDGDDTTMGNAKSNGDRQATMTEAAEVLDYDVAEEDDRWMAT